jgi:hypothetical protein
MDLPVELVGFLKHAGVDGKKLTFEFGLIAYFTSHVHFLQGFWDSSVFRYFVGINCLPVIVVEVWVDRSLLYVNVDGLWTTHTQQRHTLNNGMKDASERLAERREICPQYLIRSVGR